MHVQQLECASFFFLLPQNVASIIMIALLFYVNSYHLQIATEYL